jgi:hypothetical protein
MNLQKTLMWEQIIVYKRDKDVSLCSQIAICDTWALYHLVKFT